MKKLGVFGSLVLVSIYTHAVSAETAGNVYLGLGASALALDNDRVVDIPTSSPGHSSKMINGIIGYQFDGPWAVDLTLGTDFSGEVGTDQFHINGYRFFGANKWKPYLSAGFSAFDVDKATDSSTQQLQGGLGVSGNLSPNVELRLGYQVFFDLGDESNTDKALGLTLNWHFTKPKAMAVSQPAPVAQPESAPRQKQVVDTYELVVEFDFDKYNIKKIYTPQFDKIAKVLRENPDIDMTIEGHTDWIGTEAYNQGLSERRANAVKNRFIRDYGLDGSRISTIGYGETRPIADNKTAAGRQRNRRAISVIVKPRIVPQ